MEFKLPDGYSDRDEALAAMLRQEAEALEAAMVHIREAFLRFLTCEKGYLPEDIESDLEFDVSTGGNTAVSSADIVISISGKRMMAVMLSADALVSRQRYAVACSRLVSSFQVPFSVITDGEDAIVLETVSGKEIDRGIEAIPSRDRLERAAASVELKVLPAERIDREKRIVQAFDSIGSAGI